MSPSADDTDTPCEVPLKRKKKDDTDREVPRKKKKFMLLTDDDDDDITVPVSDILLYTLLYMYVCCLFFNFNFVIYFFQCQPILSNVEKELIKAIHFHLKNGFVRIAVKPTVLPSGDIDAEMWGVGEYNWEKFMEELSVEKKLDFILANELITKIHAIENYIFILRVSLEEIKSNIISIKLVSGKVTASTLITSMNGTPTMCKLKTSPTAQISVQIS